MVQVRCKKDRKLERLAESLENIESDVARIFVSFRKLIITFLLFVGFLTTAYGIWITMTAHNPIKSANEIEQHHTVTRITKD